MPEISVIIPVFNSEKHIEKAIYSVLNQSFENFECIIVNDGSNDNSKNIIEDIAKKDKRIKIFHKENGGASSARNMGLLNAKGEFIAFLDSDDEMIKDNLEKKYKLLKTLSNDYFGVFGTFIKNPGKEQFFPDFDGVPNPDFIDKKDGFPGGVPMYLFRKNHLIEIGLFDENLKVNEDYDLIARLIKLAYKVKGNSGLGFIRNMINESLSRPKNYEKMHFEVKKFLNKAETYSYFSKEELNLRKKQNELRLAKEYLNNFEIKKFLISNSKAFSYDKPRNYKQVFLYFIYKFYLIFKKDKHNG